MRLAIFVLVIGLCNVTLTSCGTLSPKEERMIVLQENMAFFCDRGDEELAREAAEEIFAMDKDNRMARHYLKLMDGQLKGEAEEGFISTEGVRLRGIFTGDQNTIIDAFVKMGEQKLPKIWKGLSIKGDRFSVSKAFYSYLSELGGEEYSLEGFIQSLKDSFFDEFYPEEEGKDEGKWSEGFREKKYPEFCDNFDKDYFDEARDNYRIFKAMEEK